MAEKGNRSKAVLIMSITAAAIFLAAIFILTIGFSADDANGYNWVYQRYELGERPENVSMLNPKFAMLSILYFLRVGVDGAWLCSSYYAFWYFGCAFMTLLLALRNTGANRWWLFFAAVFLMIPSGRTNQYHLVPAFMALLALYFIARYQETRNKLFSALAAGVMLYTLLTVNDKALFLLSLPASIAVCGTIWCIQNKKYHKYLYWGSLLCAFAMMAAKVLDIVMKATRGNGLALFGSLGGYGGSDYASWIDMGTLFNRSIPSFFSALLFQYNIPLQGGFMQGLSFFWVIRVFMVGLALASCMAYLGDMLKIRGRGIQGGTLVDSLSVAIVVIMTLVNIMNGDGKFIVGVDGWPINRYNSVAWFLIVVMLIRWLDRKYCGIELNFILHRKILSQCVLAIIFASLTAGYAADTRINGKFTCKDEIDFVESRDEYHYGLGSFWKSLPVMARTNGRYIVCTGWIPMDEAVLQCGNSDVGNFTDGSNIFNYIISDLNNAMTLDAERIDNVRGDYIDKNVVGSSEIYLYDYDIRWAPRLIMEAVGADYELIDDIEYHFDFPVGTNRVEMDVANSGNFALAIGDNNDVDNVTVTNVSENKIYIDLVCRQNTAVTLKVGRKEDEATTIHKIVLKRVKGAVEVSGNEIYLKEGSYIITINGSGLNNAQAVFVGEGIAVKRLTDGRIKNRYRVDVSAPQTIKFEITGNGISVDKVFYENDNLLDENSINNDSEYFWNM